MVIDVISSHTQRVEFGKFLAQRGFDAEVQRHVRAGASSADTSQPDSRRIPFHGDQLDIATVGIEIRPYSIEHGLDTFLRDHGSLSLDSPNRVDPDTRESATGMPATGDGIS